MMPSAPEMCIRDSLAAEERTLEVCVQHCIKVLFAQDVYKRQFHTRLMAPAGDALAKRFSSEPFGEMQVPVLFNCLGREKAEQDSICLLYTSRCV